MQSLGKSGIFAQTSGRKDNYTRVSVGHKLTSVLMLTHCPPELVVRSPWNYWTLDIPVGLCKWRINIFFSINPTEKNDKHKDLITSFIKGVCISIHDRKNVKEKGWAKRSGSKRTRGEPDWYGRSYVLSRPVTIDFRDHIKAIFEGRKVASLTVQFPVWPLERAGLWHRVTKTEILFKCDMLCANCHEKRHSEEF